VLNLWVNIRCVLVLGEKIKNKKPQILVDGEPREREREREYGLTRLMRRDNLTLAVA
jgi:hypothetical protein